MYARTKNDECEWIFKIVRLLFSLRIIMIIDFLVLVNIILYYRYQTHAGLWE